MSALLEAPRWARSWVTPEAGRCRFCGRIDGTCPPATCMLCGSVQCFYNGFGDGCCSICYVGYLPGWSRNNEQSVCGRARCEAQAVSKAPRVKQVCAEHAKVTQYRRGITLVEHVAERIKDRDAGTGHGAVRWLWAA
jgi:hypothetical protein